MPQTGSLIDDEHLQLLLQLDISESVVLVILLKFRGPYYYQYKEDQKNRL